MRRLLLVAALGFMVSSIPLWAQRGGGAHGASHAGFAGRSSGSFHSGSFHAGSFGGSRMGNFARRSGVRIRTLSPYRYRGSYGWGYYPYGYYPYLGYAWDSDSYDDQPDRDVYAESYAPPPPYRDDSGLQRDVEGLNSKIDRLQADVEARNHPKTEQEPETALVFRDKHVEEVRNYAISGATLWVLNDAAAKKIPLAQLDLDATVKMNDDRGVDFQVPQPSLSIMISR